MTSSLRYKQGNDERCDSSGTFGSKVHVMQIQIHTRNKHFADHPSSQQQGMRFCTQRKIHLPFHIRTIARSFFFFFWKLHCLAFPEGAALHRGWHSSKVNLLHNDNLLVPVFKDYNNSTASVWTDSGIGCLIHTHICTPTHTGESEEMLSCLFQQYKSGRPLSETGRADSFGKIIGAQDLNDKRPINARDGIPRGRFLNMDGFRVNASGSQLS